MKSGPRLDLPVKWEFTSLPVPPSHRLRETYVTHALPASALVRGVEVGLNGEATLEIRIEWSAPRDELDALPPVVRGRQEPKDIREYRERLITRPNKFLVLERDLERQRAHNLARRLRRAGGMRIVMRRSIEGTYALLGKVEES